MEEWQLGPQEVRKRRRPVSSRLDKTVRLRSIKYMREGRLTVLTRKAVIRHGVLLAGWEDEVEALGGLVTVEAVEADGRGRTKAGRKNAVCVCSSHKFGCCGCTVHVHSCVARFTLRHAACDVRL